MPRPDYMSSPGYFKCKISRRDRRRRNRKVGPLGVYSGIVYIGDPASLYGVIPRLDLAFPSMEISKTNNSQGLLYGRDRDGIINVRDVIFNSSILLKDIINCAWLGVKFTLVGHMATLHTRYSVLAMHGYQSLTERSFGDVANTFQIAHAQSELPTCKPNYKYPEVNLITIKFLYR
ncbi:hypothetical protein J6590_003101 [Homalodisca vitripennis]|nr:hypothetical protein J6590_003101 [Homalodisca vitripennis]